MLTEKQIDETIRLILKRPEMYAGNPESLAFQVVALLHVKTEHSPHKEFFAFGQKYLGLDGNAIPFYNRINITVPEMAQILIEFVKEFA